MKCKPIYGLLNVDMFWLCSTEYFSKQIPPPVFRVPFLLHSNISLSNILFRYFLSMIGFLVMKSPYKFLSGGTVQLI